MNGREPYLEAARRLLDESGCTVRRWRTHSTGLAYTSSDDWGIIVPEPRGPISYGTFAHEVAHQMLHRGIGRRLHFLKEIEAWEWALDTFDRLELPGRDRAEYDASRCLLYAAKKALRRSRNTALTRALIDERLRERWPHVAATIDALPEPRAAGARPPWTRRTDFGTVRLVNRDSGGTDWMEATDRKVRQIVYAGVDKAYGAGHGDHPALEPCLGCGHGLGAHHGLEGERHCGEDGCDCRTPRYASRHYGGDDVTAGTPDHNRRV